MFEASERATLRPLPVDRYELAEWKTAKVNIDDHISVEGHLYSVPYRLVGAEVSVRLTATTLEVLRHGVRVAAHARSASKGRYTTEPTHRPTSHQQHLEWSPSRLIAWGAGVGDATARVVEAILARQPHPEHGYRACLGLLSLSRRYDRARLEVASARALTSGAVSYRAVKSILDTGLDQFLLEEAPATLHLPAMHAHVRGAAYYQTCAADDAAHDVRTRFGDPAC